PSLPSIKSALPPRFPLLRVRTGNLHSLSTPEPLESTFWSLLRASPSECFRSSFSQAIPWRSPSSRTAARSSSKCRRIMPRSPCWPMRERSQSPCCCNDGLSSKDRKLPGHLVLPNVEPGAYSLCIKASADLRQGKEPPADGRCETGILPPLGELR